MPSFVDAVVRSAKPPGRALTIEHEPTGRELTQFKPQEARSDLGTVEVLAAYGTKLRDDSKLHELAVRKLEIIVDIVEWVAVNIRPHGWALKNSSVAAAQQGMSLRQVLETLGYSPTNSQILDKWRKLAKAVEQDTDAAVEQIVNGWKMRAGMLAPPEPKEKPAEDRDLVVESIFRAYVKLDPDQRIELKQKIMAFEKSYKDPFAPKAV